MAQKNGRKTPRKSPTRERPKCDCENKAEVRSGSAVIYTASGLAQLGRSWRGKRIKVEVASTVQCDPDTQQCLYEYKATASVQKLDRRRWQNDRTKKAFVKVFEVHDSVNESISAERHDEPELTVVTWNPNSPLKESTPVTLTLAPATRTGRRVEIKKRSVVICVPTGAVAKCP